MGRYLRNIYLSSTLTDEEFQVIYQGKNDVYCCVKLKNGYVTIKGECWGDLTIPTRTYFDLTTLPEKYRPSGNLHFFVSSIGLDANIFGVTRVDGVIQFYSTAEAKYWAYCFTYPVG